MVQGVLESHSFFEKNKISMLDPWQPYMPYYEIDPVLELGRALFYMDTGTIKNFWFCHGDNFGKGFCASTSAYRIYSTSAKVTIRELFFTYIWLQKVMVSKVYDSGI